MKTRVNINYELMRSGYCHALQTAWTNYCKAYKEWLDSIWFNEHGEMCMLYTKQAKEKAEKASEVFFKAQKDLNDFDAWVRIEKSLKGAIDSE